MLWISAASGMVEILLKPWSATTAVSLGPKITFSPRLTPATGKLSSLMETLHFASVITKATDFWLF